MESGTLASGISAPQTMTARAQLSSFWALMRRAVNEVVRQAFKPEFVNRLDDIVVFSPLSEIDLGQIVELYIDRLQKRLGERRLQLAVTPDARSWLAERGYDPIYGARPLRRLMQHEIDDRLATALLSGTIRDGDTVRVDLAGDALTIAAMDDHPIFDAGEEEPFLNAENGD